MFAELCALLQHLRDNSRRERLVADNTVSSLHVQHAGGQISTHCNAASHKARAPNFAARDVQLPLLCYTHQEAFA